MAAVAMTSPGVVKPQFTLSYPTDWTCKSTRSMKDRIFYLLFELLQPKHIETVPHSLAWWMSTASSSIASSHAHVLFSPCKSLRPF